MSVPYRINSMKKSRLQFLPENLSGENVFVSEYFITLCGFTSQQTDLLSGWRLTTGTQYFNLKDLVGLVADNEYCCTIQPPSNLSINSLTLGSGIHNFTGDISRKICSISNYDYKYSIIRKIKDPVWFETVKITGGVLHISLSSIDYNQEHLSSMLEELIIHLEVRVMDYKENRKMLFAELSSHNQNPQTHQTFIGKLSQPIIINNNSTISLQSVQTGGFMNVFGEDQNIGVVKTYEGIVEKSIVRISEHTFKSTQDFLKCLNNIFEVCGIQFSQRKKHMSILNKNKNCVVMLNPSDLINQMWGRESIDRASPITLKPNRLYTLPHKMDLYIGLPKVLSIRVSLEPNEGFANNTTDHQNIVFLNGLENPCLFELEDVYSHPLGVFNYIRITFLNMFDNFFCISNNLIHVSVIIDNTN